MLIEVMGRDAGWIALHAGFAGGAHIILVPEIQFTSEPVCDAIRARELRGKRFRLIVVAEGVKLPPADPSGSRFRRRGRETWRTRLTPVTVLGHCIGEGRQHHSTGYWGRDLGLLLPTW
jgi:6-phosphofructokinase